MHQISDGSAANVSRTRLATQIFEERLLDREQYLDWLTTSLENAKYLQLPIWLLLVQIYWKHLVSNRQRGKRLAEALLNHLNSVSLTNAQNANFC